MTDLKHDRVSPENLPDLTRLSPSSEAMAIRRYFLGAGDLKHEAHVLQLNAVRLSDNALAEYTLARDAVLKYHDSTGPGITHILRASGHLENCVWAIERFIKHAKALRANVFVPEELARSIPKNLSVLSSNTERAVTRMRHTLAHLEGQLLKGELPEGSDVILLPKKQGLGVGKHLIPWVDLVQWIIDINACAALLSEYRAPLATPD